MFVFEGRSGRSGCNSSSSSSSKSKSGRDGKSGGRSDKDKDKDKTAYFKIPVSYEISGNYLGYLKFRRALAKSNKVINFDREEIKVKSGGGINSIGTISIVGLPDEYE